MSAQCRISEFDNARPMNLFELSMVRAAFVTICLLVLAACSKKQTLPSDVLQVRAHRVAASKGKKPQDILPYDEAIAWHEYVVDKELAGELEAGVKRIRVAHWTVRHGKAMPCSEKLGEEVTLTLRTFGEADSKQGVATSDDLELTADEPPRFYDATWELAQAANPEHSRLDYWGTASDQMTIYWKLRSQLRLVIMGNSHGTKDVCPRTFYGGMNWQTPVAINMSPPGSNNALQCLVLKQYVEPLPHIEWIVWVLSPRNFNDVGDDARKYRDFINSPGYQYDYSHWAKLWPAPSAPLVTLADLKKLDIGVTDWWGWEGRAHSKIPESLDEARPLLLDRMKSVDFRFSEAKWRELTTAVDELSAKGIRLLLLTPPFHPVSAEAAAADPDGTSHEGQKELVRRLQEYAASKRHVWFRDFNKDGHHDFVHSDFYDEDHLNRQGSFKLTDLIVEWMNQCQALP